jgi:hypothetical protein
MAVFILRCVGDLHAAAFAAPQNLGRDWATTDIGRFWRRMAKTRMIHKRTLRARCARYFSAGATGAFCPERLSASATKPDVFISSMKACT